MGNVAVSVILHVEPDVEDAPLVAGEIESRFGHETFCGWLELLSHLERVVDRARIGESDVT